MNHWISKNRQGGTDVLKLGTFLQKKRVIKIVKSFQNRVYQYCTRQWSCLKPRTTKEIKKTLLLIIKRSTARTV